MHPSPAEIDEMFESFFTHFDKDQSGSLNLEQYRAAFAAFSQKMEVELDPDYVDAMFEVADEDKSGCLSREQMKPIFIGMITNEFGNDEDDEDDDDDDDEEDDD